MGFQQCSGVLLLPPGGISAELVGAMHDPIVAVGCDGPRGGIRGQGRRSVDSPAACAAGPAARKHDRAAELDPDGGWGSACGQSVPARGGGGGGRGAGGAAVPEGRRHRVLQGGVRAVVRGVRYAVARADLRGTGSSEGVATDKYPASGQADLCRVIGRLASQSWSTGSVGMYGTSYSGLRAVRWNHRKRARICVPVSGAAGGRSAKSLSRPAGRIR
jgi:hypothetical protein